MNIKIILITFILCFIGLSFSMPNCYQTLKKCRSIRKQEKLCKKKPLKEYKKRLKSANEYLQYANKEFDFFNSIELDGKPNGCTFFANIFSFQLIESLLLECVKLDNSYKNNANILLAKSYLSWGVRGKNAVKNKKFFAPNENYVYKLSKKIQYLNSLSQYFSKGIENLSELFSRSKDKSVPVKLVVNLYVEYAKLYEAIAIEYAKSPIPKELDEKGYDEYKRVLKTKANNEFDNAIRILDELVQRNDIKIDKANLEAINFQKSSYRNMKDN